MSNDADRRAHILDAAARLVARHGPSRTTVADIAREAKVGVGTVYLEFCSKEAIVEALSGDLHRRVLEAMRGAAEGRGPFSERLCALFEARVDAYLEAARGGASATELMRCTTPGVKACHAAFMAEQRELVAALLDDASSSHEFEVLRPREAAGALLRCYAGFSPPWLFEQPEAEMRAALAAVHQVVLRGLLRR